MKNRKIRLRSIVILAIFIAFASCNTQSVRNERSIPFNLLDSLNVMGSVLFFDLSNDVYYSNDFAWARVGRLPASTFKIPNSIIAIETGIVENENDILKWRGESRDMKIWEKDMPLKEAFHLSCVPCFQEIARKVGVETMNFYVNQFNYGQMDIDSSNIDEFWLEGESKINLFQQIQFLNDFYQEEFNIKPTTYESIKRMMIISDTERYVLRGKTGWSVRDGNNNGWFVGYITTKPKGDIWFFATNLEPKENIPNSEFLKARKKVTLAFFDLIEKNY